MPKLYYAPFKMAAWESLQPDKPVWPPLTFVGVGAGFIPVYESMEECQRAWPDATVMTLSEPDPESEKPSDA